MKKLKIILVVTFLIFISIFLYLWFFTIDRNDLKGDMLFAHSIYKQENDGLSIYNIRNNKDEIIYKSIFTQNAVFSVNKDNILINDAYDGVFEFNIAEKLVTKININFVSYAKFLPCSNNISYLRTGNENKKEIDSLYIYSKENSEEQKLFEFDGQIESYSWKSTGKELIFSDHFNIYNYNLETTNITKLFEGREAVYSNNDHYIAYMSKENKIVVFDTLSEKSYIRSGSPKFGSLVFSPDDKYVAYIESYYGLVAPESKLYVLDYKNNRRMLLLKPTYSLAYFDWK